MIILGLDPGTATTGYGLIKKDGSDMTCLEFGCVTTRPGLDDATRLRMIREKLARIIKKYKPGLASVEKIFFTTNAKTVISVAQARGVALEVIASSNIPILEFTPLQIKQAVTSYGMADKSQVQKMVKILLALPEPPKPADPADALAAAICAATTYATGSGLTI